jgi:hypothetical protein
MRKNDLLVVILKSKNTVDNLQNIIFWPVIYNLFKTLYDITYIPLSPFD